MVFNLLYCHIESYFRQDGQAIGERQDTRFTRSKG